MNCQLKHWHQAPLLIIWALGDSYFACFSSTPAQKQNKIKTACQDMWGEFTHLSGHLTSRGHIYNFQHTKMRRRFTVSQVLDHIFGENEGEDTEQHSDSDGQVSKEEDNVEYHPEDTDTSDQRWRLLVLKLLLLKDSSPKMVRSFGAQYLMMYMTGQLLQMSSKWPLESQGLLWPKSVTSRDVLNHLCHCH